MAESLLAKLGDLNFTAEEQDAVVVVPESVAIPVEDFACSLVGRVLSSGHLDGGRVARLFHTIWKDDKHADPACTIHDYAFRYMCIWVRIHNIPLSLMTEALARTLGACIGKVVMTDTRLEDGNMGEFLRVRVSLDTTKPLRRCVTLSRSNAKAIQCPLHYERISIFCHGCGLIGHTVLQCPTTPQGEDQKLRYGAWLRAPLPKRVSVARPRGRVSVVKDADLPPLSPAPSVASSPPASASAAAASVPYDPMLHPDISDAMEESLDIPKGCTLFSDLDEMVQSTGLDDAIDEAADALIRDVASSILGQVSASFAVPATVVSTVAACSSPLPPVSQPASTCARRLSMPPVPEQDDFEAWYAA
ncbi:hypothetical protein GQ457_03G016690 [Hibiscus cannabinus]